MNDEQRAALLACPFCGSPAELDTRQSFRAITTGRMEQAVSIYCASCTVQMMHCYSDHRGTRHEDLAADLIVAWNTRALAAPSQAVVSDIAPPPGYRWIDPEIDMLTREDADRLRK